MDASKWIGSGNPPINVVASVVVYSYGFMQNGTATHDEVISQQTSWRDFGPAFFLYISHLDALKDAVDKQIEIKREGNFSFVNYE